MRNLTRALREQDEAGAFDRCIVAGESCQEPVIKAHGIPRAVLRLIARDKKIVGNSSNPPQSPKAYVSQPVLSLRSVEQFGAGRWACESHDRLFEPIDSVDIDLDCKRNLFLVVYRTTLRATQLAMRTVGRIVFPLVDPATPEPQGVDPELARSMKEFAENATPQVISLWAVKLAMDRQLGEGDYDQLDYEIGRVNTTPSVASAGVLFYDGPRIRRMGTGGRQQVPGWYVVLPQKHGHSIVAACPRGFRRFVEPMTFARRGGTRRPWRRQKSGTSYATKLAFKTALDLAVSPGAFEAFRAEEVAALQAYMAQRSVTEPDDWPLPEVVKPKLV